VQKLLEEGYQDLGLTSNLTHAKVQRIDSNVENYELLEFDYKLPDNIRIIIEEYKPHVFFNFAAKTSGRGMFDHPYETHRLNGVFVIEILEAIRRSKRVDEIVFCQASSSEMYGDVSEVPQTEKTPFNPQSPYGAAKLYAHNMVKIYRSIYGLRCCSAILFNHESVRRTTDFVTKKIAHAAARIKLGLTNELSLNSLDSKRDWGYAPEYVDAMYKMTCAENLDDYVVASGKLSSVRDLCEAAFEFVDLNYNDYVQTQKTEARVIDSMSLLGNPEKINRYLGWSNKKSVRKIMHELVEHEYEFLK
jgi:GDPmannose 4,6-dehydratase